MASEIAVGLIYAALVCWFWPHCASPSLRLGRARPAALRIVRAVTVIAVGGSVLALALVAAGRRDVAFVAWSVPGLTWLLVVGIGFETQYRLLIRVTGGRQDRR
jgi:hypothetical protein